MTTITETGHRLNHMERVYRPGERALAGRLALSAVCHPDDPGTYAPNMIQAFVRTDVVAAGLLAFGQHVELQWHLPTN